LLTYFDFHSSLLRFVRRHIFIPPGPARLVRPIPVIVIQSASNKFMGPCIQEDAAMRHFLHATKSAWNYRGIDDTWIHPGNLHDLIENLISIINPMILIVIKARKTYYSLYSCACWRDGGIGWVLSHPAVMHVFDSDLVQVCRSACPSRMTFPCG
jgi:hypothetical protein